MLPIATDDWFVLFHSKRNAHDASVPNRTRTVVITTDSELYINQHRGIECPVQVTAHHHSEFHSNLAISSTMVSTTLAVICMLLVLLSAQSGTATIVENSIDVAHDAPIDGVMDTTGRQIGCNTVCFASVRRAKKKCKDKSLVDCKKRSLLGKRHGKCC